MSWQRWNSTTHIFEKSEDNGSVWLPLPLSGATITEGTIPNVAYKNVANAFTQQQTISSNLIISGGLYESGRSVAAGGWINWTPTVSNASGTALTVGTVVCRYMLLGQTFFYAVYVDNIGVGVATAHIRISYPSGITFPEPGHYWAQNRLYSSAVGYISGIARPAANYFEMTRFDDSTIPVSTVHIYSTIGFFRF